MKKLSFLAILLCFLAQSAWADYAYVSDEPALNKAINDGDNIILTGDIILSEYLKIGQSGTQNVTIDLNGFTLKRSGLMKADRNGHVIEVWGAGTLTLSNGTLSGGWAENGGGICNYGTVTLSNVTITGCKANLGGGIKNYSEATLNLHSGVNITGNIAAEDGGGIWNDGTLNVQGNVVVTGNTLESGLTQNVFLESGKVITLTGALTTGDNNANIGVTLESKTGTFTQNYNNFHSNDAPSHYFNADISVLDLYYNGSEASLKTYGVNDVYYIDRYWNGNKVVHTPMNCTSYTEITSDASSDYIMDSKGGWYVVKGSDVKRGIIKVNVSDSDAKLILCDGAKLSATRIQILAGHLYIYGQSDHPDKIGEIVVDARNLDKYSGIGGLNDKGAGGAFTVVGGKVKAYGGEDAAGIGSGGVIEGGSGGNLTVYGGIIEAHGGEDGAGIGGGENGRGATIKVYGGTVRAYGGEDAAGIGSGMSTGNHPDGGTLEVYGGYVFADGSGWGAGIGAGEEGNGATVTITGGIVEAWAGADAGDQNGSAIGSEKGDNYRGSLTLGPNMMVTAGSNPSSNSLFKESQRTSACFWRPYARIEPCTHKNASFSVTGTGVDDYHSLDCAYCEGFYGQHVFTEDKVCDVCGVLKTIRTVSYYLPEKSGDVFSGYYASTPQEQKVEKGTTITLPSVPNGYVPAGLKFVGWVVGEPGDEEQYYKDGAETIYEEGNPYKVEDDVSLKARYETFNFSLANASENYSLLFENDGLTVNSVTLTDHTFYEDGNWNTICLPFDLGIENNLDDDGVEVKTLVSSTWENGVLTLNFTTDPITTLEAGKPYLIKWNESGEDFIGPIFSNVTITKEMDPVVTDYVSFVGTYDPVDIYMAENPTRLYLGADNGLYFPSKSFNVNTCRGYFALRQGLYAAADGIHDSKGVVSGASRIVLNFDGETTGITTINDSNTPTFTGDVWYTLDGRRLNGKPTRSGVYVNNKRKMRIR